MDVTEKSLACSDVLTRYHNGVLTSANAREALLSLGADPHDADELMAVAMGGDDVIELAE